MSYMTLCACSLRSSYRPSVPGLKAHSSKSTLPCRRFPRICPVCTDQMRTRWSKPMEMRLLFLGMEDMKRTLSCACHCRWIGIILGSPSASRGPRMWSTNDDLGLGGGGAGMVVTPLRRRRSSWTVGILGGGTSGTSNMLTILLMLRILMSPASSPVANTARSGKVHAASTTLYTCGASSSRIFFTRQRHVNRTPTGAGGTPQIAMLPRMSEERSMG
mmetsp:Transcript_47845/g.116504  ORF Transcript_47845/g.116504 Transcript_47845/m.116504 type:complete len:217 (+) Transcript_47845:333-983(+)